MGSQEAVSSKLKLEDALIQFVESLKSQRAKSRGIVYPSVVDGDYLGQDTYSRERIVTKKPKTEAYRRQMRIANQIATALTAANLSRDYTRYERVSRLLSGLEWDMHEHGQHLLNNRSLSVNFVREIEKVMSMGKRVIVQIGVYDGKDGYRLIDIV